jgi:hypothetical protein
MRLRSHVLVWPAVAGLISGCSSGANEPAPPTETSAATAPAGTPVPKKGVRRPKLPILQKRAEGTQGTLSNDK